MENIYSVITKDSESKAYCNTRTFSNLKNAKKWLRDYADYNLYFIYLAKGNFEFDLVEQGHITHKRYLIKND